MDPVFLSIHQILELHKDQIERYSGSDGIRDLRLLQSAVETPKATFGGHFLHGNLYEMASAYLFHIVQNHPFLDGNKRTGALAAIVFLDLNGIELEADQDSFERLVLDVAQGKSDKKAIASFLKANSRSRD